MRIIRHEKYEPYAEHPPAPTSTPTRPKWQGVDISYDQPGDIILRWASYLHYGNFGGPWWEAVWVFLGLTPALLAITGALMWWNGSLSKKWNRLKAAQSRP